LIGVNRRHNQKSMIRTIAPGTTAARRYALSRRTETRAGLEAATGPTNSSGLPGRKYFVDTPSFGLLAGRAAGQFGCADIL
jgi:hypothetical protein